MRVNPNTGAVYNSSGKVVNAQDEDVPQDIPIKNTQVFDQEHRVIPDTDAPNSAAFPTIKDYLVAEDGAGFNLLHMDQYMIVTSDA
jgi:hypothetical protein